MSTAKEAHGLLMSPWFWLVFHSLICAIALAFAASRKLWWTSGMAIAGAILGGVLAVVPIAISMAYYTATTGFDAGNAGMLFVCTIPLFPPIGIVLGAALGYTKDRSRGRSWHGKTPPHMCESCGYDVRHLRGSVCPECGHRLGRSGVQSGAQDAAFYVDHDGKPD